jgi:hypothetical protein
MTKILSKKNKSWEQRETRFVLIKMVQSVFSFSKTKTTEMDFTPSVFLKKMIFIAVP